VHHHLRAGFDRIFVFFDDPDDPLIDAVPDDDRVDIAVNDAELQACWARWPALQRIARHNLAARQMLNAAFAVQLCHSAALSWLVVLAPDELLVTDGRELADSVSELAASVGQLALPCLAAVPESERVTDPFAEVTLFKRPQRAATTAATAEHAALLAAAGHTAASWFAATEDGRVAVRTAPGILPASTFRFNLGASAPQTVSVRSPRVLRYRDASFDAFTRRHATWGPLSSELFGHVALEQRQVDALLSPRAAVARGGARRTTASAW